MNPKIKKYLYIGGAILAIAVLLFSGYMVGLVEGEKTTTQFTVQNVKNIDDDAQQADFQVFWEAWDKLKDLHIKKDQISSQDLVYGAIKGLAGSFNDPYTVFFPPSDAEKFEQDVTGVFGGIGAEISIDETGTLVVIAPLKNSPAETAGVQSGDYILKVDGKSTDGMSTDEAVKIIRGPEGSPVVLNIYREGFFEPQDITVIRARIEVPTLDYRLVDDGRYALIQLYSFNENASKLFAQALQRAVTDKAQGIILDLRNNPGGFLDVATELSGWFIEKGGTVVTERFSIGNDSVFTSRGNGAFKDFPVVILINQGSASASEILAGALRDHNNTPLVGRTSFGKGTVQELVSLRDKSSLKITIAQWVMPGGDILTEAGITPDYEVNFTPEDIEAGIDVQLNKAIEVLDQTKK
ncbi:MAG: peptidase S41 [Candidatus Harrisonbacteria bacterium CG10_big_fil_rev_8_21_14_0_10_44_23]|uniref:Peptidase S41 n=1 Tax=Candidatus Harrisonbacteria bacterium CG10_big_fil_rev_8_21_14_0_10_44_23 TaxID=1974585 RepID=A0A2H0US77_9BACT|nr:MAG: peptidase S41 [Candidatus Harrisonbacteria bacterium CG10_big_fil_rev_8_21_14_0_10_44_23]